jgi:hypothetical protein
MPRVVQPPDGNGSLRDIQTLINRNADLINSKIRESFPALSSSEIEWLSPLESDEYAEYSDDEFIELIGLDPIEFNLRAFWPRRGPQWDALARTTSGEIILVEAKANIPELVSPATSAAGDSLVQIEASLEETKRYLRNQNPNNWSGTFYQYTNRIAHLYLFRILREKPAFLVNIYFTNDTTVSGPRTNSEWKAALKVVKTYFGLSRHRLNKYATEVFIDVNQLDI